ncbi:hypothetical protein CAFE_30440 [Caprobacter fermentans]|uniref:Uncharacterized protein n=1 Tax=Caproicibacter fermentans TaxID=2576756 RepID=A0A6N8I2F9_9FIRM|nr:hypothetical protein [Caproicibacter fermentans]
MRIPLTFFNREVLKFVVEHWQLLGYYRFENLSSKICILFATYQWYYLRNFLCMER